MYPTPPARPAREPAHRPRQIDLRRCQTARLIDAARVLIPVYGLSVSLGHIAVHAGLSRHVARGLFNSTQDLALVLIERAWTALAEAARPPPGEAAADTALRLLGLIRARAEDHRILHALSCGLRPHQMADLACHEDGLAACIGAALAQSWPGLAPSLLRVAGRRALALLRAAALSEPPEDARVEAEAIAAAVAAHLAHRAAAHAEPQAPPIRPDAIRIAAPARAPRAPPAPAPARDLRSTHDSRAAHDSRSTHDSRSAHDLRSAHDSRSVHDLQSAHDSQSSREPHAAPASPAVAHPLSRAPSPPASPEAPEPVAGADARGRGPPLH